MVANFKSNDPLTTVSQKSPCKVCNCIRRCAEAASGNNLLCANSTASIDDIINGYKCISTSNPSSHCSHSFVKVDQYSQTTTKQSPKPTKPTKPAMSREDRDFYNRKIISTLKLNDRDRTHLKDIRGLTDQQIDDWGFRSTFPNQRLAGNDWPDNLPGYRHDKHQLAISGEGILTPIKQLDQIVGFKVRLSQKKGDQRYTCVSDKNYTRYHIDGEQPLAVLLNENNDYSQGEWLTEGNELKPVILHQKHNLPVLGGARYWHTSKNHAAKFLPLVKEKTEIINLAVDAGDILNYQGIPLKWCKEYKFFESQGFNPRFAWWGQITKESPDIDELPDLSSVEFISLDQFKELIKAHNPTAYQQIEDLEKTPLLTLAVDNTKPSDEPLVMFNQIALKELYGDGLYICANEKFYQWQGTYYKELNNALELKRCRDFCNAYDVSKEDKEGNAKIKYPFASPQKVNEIFKWAQISLAVSSEKFTQSTEINCKNGVLVIGWNGNKPTPKLEPHNPQKHFFTTEPIITYNPKADKKYCDQLLRCLDTKQLQILLRILGASLDLSTVRKNKGRLIKVLFCIGHGSNGKDSIREVLSLIFGSDKVSNFSLNDFIDYDNGNKNSLAGLSQSRVNWASESGKTTRIDNSLSLKRFATGDTLTERYLFKDGRNYIPTAIALFNLNELPNLYNTGQAALDRFAPLTFRKTFVKAEDYDPMNPYHELADPRFKYDRDFLLNDVAPAFLNYMIQGLQDLMVEGIDYTPTREALDQIQSENNHLFEFIDAMGWKADPHAAPIQIGALYEYLENWYKDQEILAVGDFEQRIWAEPVKPSDRYVKGSNQLFTRLKELFPNIQKVEMRLPGCTKATSHIKGISMILDTSKQNIITSTPPTYTPVYTPVSPIYTPVYTPDENTSNVYTAEVLPSSYTPDTPVSSQSSEKIEILETNQNFATETRLKNPPEFDDGRECYENKESLPETGVSGVYEKAELLNPQGVEAVSNWGITGVKLGYKSEETGVYMTEILESDAQTNTQASDLILDPQPNPEPTLEPGDICLWQGCKLVRVESGDNKYLWENIALPITDLSGEKRRDAKDKDLVIPTVVNLVKQCRNYLKRDGFKDDLDKFLSLINQYLPNLYPQVLQELGS